MRKEQPTQKSKPIFNVEEILKLIQVDTKVNFGYRRIDEIDGDTFNVGDIFYRKNHLVLIFYRKIHECENEIYYEGLRLNLSDLSFNIEKTTELMYCRYPYFYEYESDDEKHLEPLYEEPYIWLGNIKFITEYDYSDYLSRDKLKNIYGFVKVLTQFLKNNWLSNITNSTTRNFQIKFQPKTCWIHFWKLQEFELYYDPTLDIFGVVIDTDYAFWFYQVVSFDMKHQNIDLSTFNKNQDKNVFSLGTIAVANDSGTQSDTSHINGAIQQMFDSLKHVPWLLKVYEVFNPQASIDSTKTREEEIETDKDEHYPPY